MDKILFNIHEDLPQQDTSSIKVFSNIVWSLAPYSLFSNLLNITFLVFDYNIDISHNLLMLGVFLVLFHIPKNLNE